MELLRNKVLRFIREQNLFKPGDTLVVAFSGGADSTALLDILANLPGFAVKLVVTHLNHLLRGADSAEDELFARGAAARYGCQFEFSRIDVASQALQRKLSLEEAGREARYDFFREVAAKHVAATIAVGHHKGDQAETVLMRLLRGAGGSGLCGMRPRSADGMIVRPLLSSTRVEIEAYLHKRGLTWREDTSNADVRFLRNRVRHELVPYLESLAPDIVERLQQTAEALAADEDLLETVAAEEFSRTMAVTAAGVEADLDLIRHQPPSLRKRLYRKAIYTVKGDLRRISFTHLAAIDRIVYGNRPNSELTLPGGTRLVREYGVMLFTLQQEDSLSADCELLLDCPGDYALPYGGRLLVEECEADSPPGSALGNGQLMVSSAQLQFPFTIRYYRNGDRFIPQGMSGRKKLKDLFIDRKVPLRLRKKTPLLVQKDEIIWVCGIQASEKMRSSAACREFPFLRLTFTAEAAGH